MADGTTWSFDKLLFPPSTTVVSSELQELDFVTYKLLDFYVNVLNNNFNGRWNTVVTGLGLTPAAANYLNGNVVAQAVAFPVTDELLKSANFKFPLMSLYREKETWLQWTTDYVLTDSQFVLTLTFPPLTAAQYSRIYPFLGAINKKILLATFNGSDPLYNNSELVLNEIGVSFVRSNGSEYGSFVAIDKSGTAVYYPSLQVKLSVAERNKYVSANGEALAGFDLDGQFVDGYTANLVDNFVDGYVNTNSAAITSLSPNSGSRNGNTLVTLSGTSLTGFTIQSITLAGIPVSQWSVKSDKTILLVSGPTLTAGTGDVVITDTLGNTVTLSNGWSYT